MKDTAARNRSGFHLQMFQKHTMNAAQMHIDVTVDRVDKHTITKILLPNIKIKYELGLES